MTPHDGASAPETGLSRPGSARTAPGAAGPQIGAECVMPTCHAATTTRNRNGQPTCATHQPVVVAVGWSRLGEGKGHHEPAEDSQ